MSFATKDLHSSDIMSIFLQFVSFASQKTRESTHVSVSSAMSSCSYMANNVHHCHLGISQQTNSTLLPNQTTQQIHMHATYSRIANMDTWDKQHKLTGPADEDQVVSRADGNSMPLKYTDPPTIDDARASCLAKWQLSSMTISHFWSSSS